MKSGAGDDPFADDDPGDAREDGQESPPADERPASPGGSSPPAAPPADATDADAEPDGPISRQDIPWVLRRGSVKDDRPNVTQFFLRDETDRAERRFQSDVEDRLDRDVYTLDLREAAYLVAMRHPEEVAEQLLEWGYDYLD